MSNIDFEQDQEKLLGKTDNIQSLADQVERLDQLLKEIELDENLLKQKKSRIVIRRSYSDNDARDEHLHTKISRRIFSRC